MVPRFFTFNALPFFPLAFPLVSGATDDLSTSSNSSSSSTSSPMLDEMLPTGSDPNAKLLL